MQCLNAVAGLPYNLPQQPVQPEVGFPAVVGHQAVAGLPVVAFQAEGVDLAGAEAAGVGNNLAVTTQTECCRSGAYPVKILQLE